MSHLDISDILITQSDLRDKVQLKDMIKFVKQGGVFDEATLGSYAVRHSLNRIAPLMEIARFEDGIMAVHNGHHRALAIYLGRNKKVLYPKEFFIREWKYTDYTDIVLPYWVTPFDVLKEFRVPELSEWKKKVREFYVLHGEEHTKRFILENRNEYVLNRTFYTVGDMSSRIKP